MGLELHVLLDLTDVVDGRPEFTKGSTELLNDVLGLGAGMCRRRCHIGRGRRRFGRGGSGFVHRRGGEEHEAVGCSGPRRVDAARIDEPGDPTVAWLLGHLCFSLLSWFDGAIIRTVRLL